MTVPVEAEPAKNRKRNGGKIKYTHIEAGGRFFAQLAGCVCTYRAALRRSIKATNSN